MIPVFQPCNSFIILLLFFIQPNEIVSCQTNHKQAHARIQKYSRNTLGYLSPIKQQTYKANQDQNIPISKVFGLFFSGFPFFFPTVNNASIPRHAINSSKTMNRMPKTSHEITNVFRSAINP